MKNFHHCKNLIYLVWLEFHLISSIISILFFVKLNKSQENFHQYNSWEKRWSPRKDAKPRPITNKQDPCVQDNIPDSFIFFLFYPKSIFSNILPTLTYLTWTYFCITKSCDTFQLSNYVRVFLGGEQNWNEFILVQKLKFMYSLFIIYISILLSIFHVWYQYISSFGLVIYNTMIMS